MMELYGYLPIGTKDRENLKIPSVDIINNFGP